jgi:hypothetical protein
MLHLQIDLPLQLCSPDEVEHFLPSLIASIELNQVKFQHSVSDQKANSEEKEFALSYARTNLSHYWVQQRERWPQLHNSFVGLICVDGAIALAPQEHDISLSLVLRVFSDHEHKYVLTWLLNVWALKIYFLCPGSSLWNPVVFLQHHCIQAKRFC